MPNSPWYPEKRDLSTQEAQAKIDLDLGELPEIDIRSFEGILDRRTLNRIINRDVVSRCLYP